MIATIKIANKTRLRKLISFRIIDSLRRPMSRISRSSSLASSSIGNLLKGTAPILPQRQASEYGISRGARIAFCVPIAPSAQHLKLTQVRERRGAAWNDSDQRFGYGSVPNLTAR